MTKKSSTSALRALGVAGLLCLAWAPLLVVRAADDPPAAVADTVAADARAVGTTVKRDAKVVAAAAKEGAQHVAVAAKEVAHEVAVATQEGAQQVAAAATAGWPMAAFSRSIELIHSPPVLMRSLTRSLICMTPWASMVAMSPVGNQPSSSGESWLL